MGVVKEGEGGGLHSCSLSFQGPRWLLENCKTFPEIFSRKEPIPNPNLAVHNNLAHPNPFSGKVYFWEGIF